MSTFRHTNVGNASARNHYGVVGQIQDTGYVWGGTGGGTADVITISTSPATTAYAAGQCFRFISSGANTGAVTLNVNALGAKAVTKFGANALVAGDIPSGAVIEVVYDGTQFQLAGIFANQLTNPTITGATIDVASGVSFPATQSPSGDANTLDDYEEGTFTPTVTLVGGAGNTVPVYSTNTGRYTKIGNQVFVDVFLTGDGGAEGAGTGQFNVALPVTASASHPDNLWPCGRSFNSTTARDILGQISASATTIALSYIDGVTVTTFDGAEQNSTTRGVRLKFFYEA